MQKDIKSSTRQSPIVKLCYCQVTACCQTLWSYFYFIFLFFFSFPSTKRGLKIESHTPPRLRICRLEGHNIWYGFLASEVLNSVGWLILKDVGPVLYTGTRCWMNRHLVIAMSSKWIDPRPSLYFQARSLEPRRIKELRPNRNSII